MLCVLAAQVTILRTHAQQGAQLFTICRALLDVLPAAQHAAADVCKHYASVDCASVD